MAVSRQYKDGKVGGVLVGRPHKTGGIKVKNVDTGQPLEVENGEVIIMADAVSDKRQHEFNGKKMTNLEILSSINQSSGGVSFMENGGKTGEHIRCGCSGKKHQYDGKEMTDYQIANRLANGGSTGKPGNDEISRARKADLITLPEGVKGTNCGNCQFVKITNAEQGNGFCTHPLLQQNVTNRMCCIYWDTPGTERVWEQLEKKMQRGGMSGINPAIDLLGLETVIPAQSQMHLAKGGKIPDRPLKLSDIPHGDTEPIKPQNIPQSSTRTAKQQADINSKIVDLVKKKGIVSGIYSAEEKALIKQYSGAGGLSKHGAKGPRILDQFFTHMDICAKMWGIAIEHGFTFKNTSILEPSAGTGNFLQFIPAEARVNVVAYDVDEISASISKILFPKYNIRHASFESMFFNGRRHVGLAGVETFFDLVIGNPPYRDYVSQYAPLGEKDATGASTFEMYFLMRGVDVLKPGGLLIYIIPNTFISNDNKYNSFKDALLKKADFIDAYRLPNGIFDFTDVGTDIIVLRKKK